jgi:hypothetical protein
MADNPEKFKQMVADQEKEAAAAEEEKPAEDAKEEEQPPAEGEEGQAPGTGQSDPNNLSNQRKKEHQLTSKRHTLSLKKT